MREEGKEKARQGTSNVVIDRNCCIGGSDYRDLCVGGCDKIVVLMFRPWCRKRGRAVEGGGGSEKQPYEGTAFGENRAPSPPPKNEPTPPPWVRYHTRRPELPPLRTTLKKTTKKQPVL